MRSRVTFASTEAAATEAQRASPSTSVRTSGDHHSCGLGRVVPEGQASPGPAGVTKSMGPSRTTASGTSPAGRLAKARARGQPQRGRHAQLVALRRPRRGRRPTPCTTRVTRANTCLAAGLGQHLGVTQARRDPAAGGRATPSVESDGPAPSGTPTRATPTVSGPAHAPRPTSSTPGHHAGGPGRHSARSWRDPAPGSRPALADDRQRANRRVRVRRRTHRRVPPLCPDPLWQRRHGPMMSASALGSAAARGRDGRRRDVT